MAAFIEETGRSFPNPISGAMYDKPFKRPSSGKYRSHSKYPDPGTSSDYVITFDGQGPVVDRLALTWCITLVRKEK